jgi:hypothetical protein
MKKIFGFVLLLLLIIGISQASAALTVPTDIEMPGTQPREVGNLESPDKCENCHGGYNRAVEPAFNWRGGMMANAGRDPLFWATVAIAEQTFDGSGDLCIRCHSTSGWMAGRSTPTDGSGLRASDADGVDCDMCHKMTNPDNTEHLGVMNAPYIANSKTSPVEGYYGSGMASLSGGNFKLGPYADTTARHQFQQSKFHRSAAFCGTCHDVSNPATGDLAHNNGAPIPLAAGKFSGVPGSPVEGKAAFNNMPYQYGVVERTFSEYMSSGFVTQRVDQYSSLPTDLKAGAIAAVSTSGNFEDGTIRYYTCQTCHMRAVTGKGANKNDVPTRTDLALHDMTGGNYWVPDAILYQNSSGWLRLGGGLSSTQIDALNAGKDRARQQLDLAASLAVSGNTVKVTNLTGHKLISGYPEGRRMWLNVKWYDSGGKMLREDGAYGPMTVTLDGKPIQVNTILDLNGTNTKIYEAHYGLTKEWASQLLGLGYDPAMALSFDRSSGQKSYTLGQLAAQPSGAYKSFHFVLNNTVIHDNRIPPYGFKYNEAQKRNALPVPANQYGGAPGGTYSYFDNVALNPPSGASYAEIKLLYQPTSWEYVQFLYLANNGQNAFLKDEGIKLLHTWLATGMAEPHVMASATWGTGAPPPGSDPACGDAAAPTLLSAEPAKKAVDLTWSATNPTGGYRIYYEQSGKIQLRAEVGPTITSYRDRGLTSRTTYCYVVTAWNDCNGNGVFDVGVDKESPISNILCATAK